MFHSHTKPECYPGNNELQLSKINDLKDPTKDAEWKQKNLAPFLIHENPQFIIQSDMVNLDIIEKGKKVKQYYYMTNDS